MNIMKLLNATGEIIEKTLRKDHEKDNGFNEKILYYGCIQGMKKVQLNKINSQDIEGPVKTFLINWGTMRRGLNTKKGWERNIERIIKSNCDMLDSFRNKNILSKNIEEIDVKNAIMDCYKAIRKCIGPTSTSKVLHIIAPNFFPMWDNAIKLKISKECKNKEIFLNGIGDSPIGYYKFMRVVKFFILSDSKRKEIISSLSKNLNPACGVSEVRTVDKYFWVKTHPL